MTDDSTHELLRRAADGDDDAQWSLIVGLARLETDAGMTVSGDLLGTLRYMSPEQALAKRGMVNARADIYSLGATLYELATLCPVYTGSDRQMLLKQIALEEPKSPRRIDSSIPWELETIILKAIRKSPEDRYATAQELGDDLKRFLDHKPIRAKAPTSTERIVKWSLRHRSLVLFSLLTIVLIAVGMAVSTVLLSRVYVRESAALEDARREFQRANANAKTAEENYRVGRKAIDRMIDSVESKLPLLPDETRKGILNEGLAYYKTMLTNRGSSKQIRSYAASAAMRVGDFQRWLSNTNESLKSYQYAAELFAALHRDFPTELEYMKRQIRAIMYIAVLHASTDQFKPAESACHEGLELCARGLQISPDDSDFVLDACALRSDLASCMRNTNRRSQAEQLCLDALNELDRIEDARDDNSRFYILRSGLRSELAVVSTRKDDALVNIEQALRLKRTQEAIGQLFLVRPVWADLVTQFPGEHAYWYTLGVAQYRARQWQAAITSYEKSTANDAATLLQVAIAYAHIGNLDESRNQYREVMKFIETEADNEPTDGRRLRLEAEELIGIVFVYRVCCTLRS